MSSMNIITNKNSINLFKKPNYLIYHNNEFDDNKVLMNKNTKRLPEVLFVTSYPPRECGIATYSNDLMNAINDKFNKSFSLKVCALESPSETYIYNSDVDYTINTSVKEEYVELAYTINRNEAIELIVIEHEFGFFVTQQEAFLTFLSLLQKPVLITFHTVLPSPSLSLKTYVNQILSHCHQVTVMTNHSAKILVNEYEISEYKINVIAHGTHLVPLLDKNILKEKYNFTGKKVFSTFGLLSEGKNIETTLNALPQVIIENPEALFLIIGKTHPIVKKEQGEIYRNSLEKKVSELDLKNHVLFINEYLPLPTLLDYLQLTDIYLFTSKDRHQAVSGTFSYAVSCGCPIISTPIPHACEVLNNESGIIIDFEDSTQLSEALILLLNNNKKREEMTMNGLHHIANTAWENNAIAHALLFNEIIENNVSLKYSLPPINLKHIDRMTTNFGMVQFSKINEPDLTTGYTLDDNARALIAICMQYDNTNDKADLDKIIIYFNFIKYCLQPNGNFLNYVNEQKEFTEQNFETNLADSNGRAIWAIGFLISRNNLPVELIKEANLLMQKAMLNINKIHSTRAMAFTIKGLFYFYKTNGNLQSSLYIKLLANRMVQMYKHESSKGWEWFESYLTYANSLLSEALLMAGIALKNDEYKVIAYESFKFIISKTFDTKGIKVISNQSWLQKGKVAATFGEQPIDVAYTISALKLFYEYFKEPFFLTKMEVAFNWFLGQNHLHQIVYNPCTGGCYDGLEEHNVNLNQGAESTISYLNARLIVENYFNEDIKINLFQNVASKIFETV